MQYKTAAQIIARVQRETDTEDEAGGDEFIRAAEWLDWINDGVDEAEAIIHKLGAEDEYFLKTGNISLVSGDNTYSLPTDIYANKIKRVIYVNGTTVITVKRMRGESRFEDAQIIASGGTGVQEYGYILTNTSAASGVIMNLYPTPGETVSNGLRVWYIRNANAVAATTDTVDLPEFYTFLYAFLKWKVESKANPGSPLAESAKIEYLEQRKLMEETLTDMVPDEDNRIIPDLTFYKEMN